MIDIIIMRRKLSIISLFFEYLWICDYDLSHRLSWDVMALTTHPNHL